jgi:microcompartment protein CcmK/EutM
MKLAQVVGRVFCTRQEPTLAGKRLLLLQPLSWESGKPNADPLVALDTIGVGASEKVYFVAAREAAHAFEDLPPADAAVVGLVEGHEVRNFR